MWGAVHAACGAALAAGIRDPLLLAGTALFSHAVLDILPHWDYRATVGNAAVDLAAAVLLVVAIGGADPLAWWGAFWAAAPDLEVGLVHLGITRRARFPSHRVPFLHSRVGVVPGVLIQLSAVAFFFLVAA